MESSDEMHDIVIVGGGICGLATALALHRKGIKSVVLEKSETLRTTGAAIGTLPNGWRALDQLGVADHLRATSLPIQGVRVKFLKEGRDQYFSTKNVGEVRYLKRRTLVETFADALPLKTIRFGCEIVSLELDPITSFPSLLLSNGNRINAKILIGCDGSRSIVASYLGIKPTKTFRISSIRGLTTYPNGHPYPHEFVRLLSGKTALGRIAITDKLVYWYVGVERGKDAKFTQDPEVIKQIALEATSEGYEADVKDMIERCETETLSLSRMKYYPPWELMFSTFSRGTVAVAGDAMHVMGPFLGQGGSSAMEDAVVLARNLAKAINGSRLDHEKALAQFVKERKMRVLKLATQSYLTVALAEDRSRLSKFVLKTIMALLFRNQGAHVQYDCGQL